MEPIMEKTIKILSHKVKVIKNSPGNWSQGGLGRAYIKDGQILLNADQAEDTLKSTLVHEIVHYVADLLSLELSEQQVDGIAMGMFTVLKDNPDITKESFYKSL